MARRFVCQLTDRETVDEVYQAGEKKLRPNRNGNLYLQVELSDRTGAVSARLWNANETIYRSFEEGDFIRVEGTAQVYQGEMQMIATRFSRVPSDRIDPADFVPETPRQVEKMLSRAKELLRGMGDEHLRALAEAYLIDEVLMQKLARAPAGIKNHHAYLGGLLEHILTMMELVQRIVEFYPYLNGDLLLLGAFLHDLSKVDELTYDRGFGYSDEGQLIGHIVMAVSMLEAKTREAEKLLGEPIPAELLLHLKHLIVSHHGEYEFGAPRLPMTLEAVALWQLDNLDAKLQSFQQQIRDDPNSESAWTLYNPQLGRKLFKGTQPQ